MPMNAQHVEYDKVDSITIEKILNNADVNRMNVVEFAKFFIGKPYRASTLEEGDREHLIVNTRQFDCLTFIEIVSSLYLCSLNHEHTFEDYCKRLLSLRYRDGVIEDYTSRLHYFTWWACDNEKRGNLFVIDKPSSMFSETRIIDYTFMSSNPSKYKHLINSKDFLNKIRCYESELNDGSFSYIPKRMLNNQNLLGFIKSGDIIAIVTSKKGLDIAHVGFAIWINEKFHLLHASSLKKKVVLDTKTLFDYS
jgi:hypothetical protein